MFVEMPEEILAQQALDGNQLAFETLVQRYQRSLFNFIYKRLGDYDQTWDVLQHVLWCLFTSLPLLEKNRSLKPWLFRVALNRCIDEIRRQGRRALPFSLVESYEGDQDDQTFLLEILDQSPSPDEMMERRELQALIHEAIASLPPKFRTVVWLRYTHHLSFAEIGEALQIPSTTAKTYYHRGKLLLRRKLCASLYNSDPPS
jgi:RNA polymerase sigma-70 factor (ECF subfamily)